MNNSQEIRNLEVLSLNHEMTLAKDLTLKNE